jgi:D-tyrosyl-tRNA(Tyr) deacylase
MRLLIQRVSEAAVVIAGEEYSRIGCGLLVFVGIEEADDRTDVEWLAGKVVQLRIFEDSNGVMNLDVRQTGGDVLVVSQFTLHASTRRGNRPSYIRAAGEAAAKPLYEDFVTATGQALGKAVATGVFGADMKVRLTNDGPVTIWIDSRHRE